MQEKYGILPYSSCKMNEGFLITTFTGSWCYLTPEEFSMLQRKNIKENLYKKLVDSGIVITENNASRIITEYRQMNRFLFQGPSLHIVVPTLRCNHECVYCHAKPPDERYSDMDKKTAIKVLDFVFSSESPCIAIEFQGGEPLLNWDTVRFIIEEANRINDEYEKRDLELRLVTNLTVMDDEKLEFLLGVKNAYICTSLDGPETVHNKNRKYRGGGETYSDVVKWIEKIKERCKNRINAIPTITRHSLPYWKEIIDEYVKHGFYTIHLRFLNKLGAAIGNWNEISYTPEEFLHFWKQSLEYILELNKQGIKLKERTAEIMLTKILERKDPGYTELMSPCGAGRTQLLYNYNGDIYTCDEGRMLGNDLFKLGNVNKNKYRDIVRSDNFIGICHASILDNYCGDCVFKPYCGTCPVMNYVEQGTLVPKI
ncbi:MAG: His-Xaa-Ser system radical SAM maturase HxsB, partial [Spirochaetes bacterium]